MCLSKFIELHSKNTLSDKWLSQVREIVTETGGKISFWDLINALFFVASGIYNKAKNHLAKHQCFKYVIILCLSKNYIRCLMLMIEMPIISSYQ